MKICIYTENYHKGGLDSFVINLINSWPNSDDKFTFVVNANHPGLEEIESRVKKNINIITYRSYYFELLIWLNKFTVIKFLLSFLRIIYNVFQYPLVLPCKLIHLIFFFLFL